MDCKLSIDLLPRQLGICSPEHFYGAGLNLELVLCVRAIFGLWYWGLCSGPCKG